MACSKLRVLQNFKEQYSKEWPCIKESKLGPKHAFCIVCNLNFTISHGGSNDCKRHIGSANHKKLASLQATMKPLSFSRPQNSMQTSVTTAEALFTEFMAEHNLPLSIADHANKLFKKMFPDSKIAAEYKMGRSKSTSILHQIAGLRINDLISLLKTTPYSISTDGSNDAEMKQYPVVVTYFNKSLGEIANDVLGNQI